jgi:hypothetical protein
MGYKSGEIYFVREIEKANGGLTNFVKIGLVHDADGRNSYDRLKEHQTGNPRALAIAKQEIVHTEAVDRVEALFHRLYAERRVSGEWFEFSSESEVKEAIKHAQKFSQEVAKIVPIFKSAEELAKVADNGMNLDADTYHLQLLKTISVATLEIARMEELEGVISGKFAQAIKAGVSDIEKVAKEQVRVIKPKFNSKAFMEANPETFEKYQVVSQRWQGSFLIDAKAKKAAEVDNSFEDFLGRVNVQVASVIRLEDSVRLNEPLLALTQQKALSEWDLDVAKAQLRVACGKYQSISGVCTWKRYFKESTVFNEGRFQEENPDLWAQYLTDEKTGTYLISKKRKL